MQANSSNIAIKEWDGKYNSDTYSLFGYIQVIENLYMPQLNHSCNVWIYLPPDYNNSAKRYPVLYFLDGQTAFGECPNNKISMLIDKTMEQLFNNGYTQGAIIAAIESNPEFRRQEYNPVRIYPSAAEPKTDQYADFIVTTLKTIIDSNFRTLPQRESTGIAGFSAGAACSIYTGLKYQQVFSKIAAFSFTLLQSFCNIPNEFKTFLPKQHPMKIYMDIGRNEYQGLPHEIREYFVKDFVQGITNFHNQLINMGYGESEIKLVIDETGIHSVSDAAKRFPEAFLWLFEKSLQMRNLKALRL